MELCYRGIRYQRQPNEIGVSETSEKIKFRGQTCQLNKSVLELKERNRENLVYRGVAFCEPKETKFLGQVCSRQSYHLALALATKKIRFLGQVSDHNLGTLITVNSAL